MTDTATPASAAATPDHVSLSIDGVAITADYHTGTLGKDVDHVVDLILEITFAEYVLS